MDAALTLCLTLLGNDHNVSLINAAEKGLTTTTFSTNGKNWKIEDYITKHVQFYSVIAEQHDLGMHPGMLERRRVDRLASERQKSLTLT